jgi:hypothetical protein
LKAEYFAKHYSKMRRGIIVHPGYVTEENIDELKQLDFVFLSMDGGPAKKFIIQKLQEWGIPFIDVGMGLELVKGAITGILTVTACTKDKTDHVLGRIPVVPVDKDAQALATMDTDFDLDAVFAMDTDEKKPQPEDIDLDALTAALPPPPVSVADEPPRSGRLHRLPPEAKPAPETPKPREELPDWIAEIVSPTNSGTDRVTKLNAYHRFEVPHYWIIDPIAETLIVSEATVKTHVAGILAKLDLRNRAQAIVLAYESGLVRAGSGSPIAS